MALIVKDSNGNLVIVQESVAVGVEVTQVARQLEVGGFIVSRTNAGGIGVAAGFASEGDQPHLPDGSLWTNPSYNPSTEDPKEPFRRWIRTINMKNGNVGIGGSSDPEAMVPQERLVVVGNILATGDVRLSGADCAEDFDVDTDCLEPGTVVIIGDEETLRRASEPYDRRVAGVLSGGGDCRPGIVLGRQKSARRRLPLALTGKVFCCVDANFAAVHVGDLLTTSSTPGHAMKVQEPSRAVGAILGKALRSLPEGRGLIPVLVTLH